MLGRVGVERPLDLLAFVRRRGAVVDRDPLLGPVGAVDRGRKLLVEVALGVVVLGEDDDPECRSTWLARRGVAPTGRSGHMFSRIQSISVRTRASGRPRGRLGDLGHLVEQLLLAGEELLAAASVMGPTVAAEAASIWASSSA